VIADIIRSPSAAWPRAAPLARRCYGGLAGEILYTDFVGAPVSA
jgi:hypothetical protein